MDNPSTEAGRQVLDDQPPWGFGIAHGFAFEFLWFLQLDPEPQKTQRWDDSESQTHPPCGPQIPLGSNEDNNHRDESGHHKPQINLDVGEHNEPSVAVAFLQFSGRFGARNTSRGILSTAHLCVSGSSWNNERFVPGNSPNTDTEEKAPGRQAGEQTVDVSIQSVGPRTQRGEQDQQERGDHQRPLARKMIAVPAEEELAHDGSRKGDGRDIGSGGGSLVLHRIELGQHRVHGSDDPNDGLGSAHSHDASGVLGPYPLR